MLQMVQGFNWLNGEWDEPFNGFKAQMRGFKWLDKSIENGLICTHFEVFICLHLFHCSNHLRVKTV